MRVPPTLCTMHLGAPVVPLEYMMNSGCENGTYGEIQLQSCNLVGVRVRYGKV